MAGGIEFDFSDLNRLAAQLGEVPDNAGENIRKAIQVSAFKVKRDWQANLSQSRAFSAGAASISYTTEYADREIRAVIGARLGGVGSLVFINEFGALSTAPKASGQKALQANQDDFVRGMSLALEDAERQAGL